jgi:hypothetical protein
MSIACSLYQHSLSSHTSRFGGATYPWILPVKVHSIKAVVVQELGDIGGEGVTVGFFHRVTKDVVCFGLGGISPAAKGDDLLLFNGLEVIPLVVRVVDTNRPVRGINGGKGPCSLTR